MSKKLINELNNLKKDDINTLALFVLYELRNDPEYAVLTELSYILGRTEMLKLCEYFGGLTIRIPNISELESVTNLIMVFQYVNAEHLSIDEAIDRLGNKSIDTKKLKEDFNRLETILENFNFGGNRDDE